jgi:hypothetical protein
MIHFNPQARKIANAGAARYIEANEKIQEEL